MAYVVLAVDDGIAISTHLLGAFPALRLKVEATTAAEITDEDIASAVMILSADRKVRGAISTRFPATRARSFTLLEAAWFAAAIERTLSTGALPKGAPAMPDDDEGRISWWVAEIDAARGVIPAPPQGKARSGRRTSPLAWQDLTSDAQAPAAAQQLSGSWAAIADGLR